MKVGREATTFGILNLNKPAGISSRTAVNKVDWLARPAKAGHAGTLDPLASGVLVVCVGAATRLMEFIQRMPKRYLATFLLGRESPTEDTEGEITLLENAPQPSYEQLVAAATKFIGEIEQRPPSFSALKVDGRRAYKLARAGKQVELTPRSIVIHSIDIVRYEYPELAIDVRCGSGTYVRSLGRDLANAVGTAAVMSALVRTEVGSFHVADAAVLNSLTLENFAEHLQSPRLALDTCPTLDVSESEIEELINGRFITRSDWIAPGEIAESPIAAIDPAGHLVALLSERSANVYGATRNFPRPL